MLESRLVVVRCCARLLLVGASVTYSALAPALGLGEITLHSALNQPLQADIALVDVAGLEEGELSISLAAADDFTRAGVERAFFLNDLKFTPILRGNRSLIRVTSNKPVNEPFLNFLVQLDQPNGRLVREYTVLIDPPGSPGIVPATEEPSADRPSSAFPSVQPAIAPLAREEPPKPAATPVIDPLAEQLAASVLQNQQLQATIDELNAKSQAQDEQIANEKQQVTDLQAQLTDVQQAAAKPIEPESVTPAPIAVAGPGADWLLIFGLLTLLALIVLGWFVRHRRRQVQIPPEPSTNQERVLSRPMESLVPTAALNPPPALGDAHDVQELSLPNAGFGVQQLQDARAHDPKLNPIAVAAAQPRSASSDEFQLNLDDLSMDSNWELTNPFEAPAAAAVGSSELSLPEPEIEWEIEPASRESIGLMQGKR